MKKALFLFPLFLIGCSSRMMDMNAFQPPPTKSNIVQILTEDGRYIEVEGQITFVGVKDGESILLSAPHDPVSKLETKHLCVNGKRAFQVVIKEKIAGQKTELKLVPVQVKD